MSRYFTGVGSEDAPLYLECEVAEIMAFLNPLGFVARSGGAKRMDTWWETYAARVEIYLPWKGFNGHEGEFRGIPPRAYRIAQEHMVPEHWANLGRGGQRCHARDVQQVLGQHCGPPDPPSEFVLCWTEGGRVAGGTATAMKVAVSHSIPVFNLYNPTPLFGSPVLDQLRALLQP
jgi:hypothetical protein